MERPLSRLGISFRSVKKHGRHMQFLFLIGQFLKQSSHLKPLGQMNHNLVGSIYGRFLIKLFLMLSQSVNKRDRQWKILFLVARFLKIFFSKTSWSNETTLCRKHLWKVRYTDCSYRSDPLINMTAIGNSCFRLIHF